MNDDYYNNGELVIDKLIHKVLPFTTPCFMFLTPHDAFVGVYQNLEEGDTPLMYSDGSNVKVFPKSISLSAYNVKKLLYVFDEILYYDENENKHVIRSPVDYLEVI